MASVSTESTVLPFRLVTATMVASILGLGCSAPRAENDLGVSSSSPTPEPMPAPGDASQVTSNTESPQPTAAAGGDDATIPSPTVALPSSAPEPTFPTPPSTAGAGGTSAVRNTGPGGTPDAPQVPGSGGVGGEGEGGTGGQAMNGPDEEASTDESMPVLDDRCDVAVYDPSNPPQALEVNGSLGTHDPTLIEQDGVFYLYNTGNGLPGKTSSDLQSWSNAPAAFGSATTSWVSQEVPAARDLWAPDLSYFDGRYHLYYSASSFGSNDSCMGHATRESMSSGSWTDHGSVICSSSGDTYNAIDPNIFVDVDEKIWLFFGSHWDGIKAVELVPTGMSAVGDIVDIAARPRAPRAIEAPVVVRRCGYYYLFVSFDQCCNNWNDGVPYNIRVGRSENVLGPYVDQDGTPMYPDGGGSLLLGPSGPYQALGHNAVIFSAGKAYNVYHAYTPGSTLRVAELVWDEGGWPISGGP